MDEQWKYEIDIFFRRLRNNDVEVVDGSIYAVYDKRNDDGRCIVYEPGAMRLRDDYYSMQHSRQLTDRELDDDEIREQALLDFEDHLAHFREWIA